MMYDAEKGLSDRLRMSAYEMLDLADEIDQTSHLSGKAKTRRPAATAISTARMAHFAATLYAQRRHRDRRLGTDVFGEPAWDILLDLFVRQSAGKATTITSACIAATCPQTTALRYLQVLQDHNLIEREPSQNDKRSFNVRLTDEGLAKMTAALAEIYWPTRRSKMVEGPSDWAKVLLSCDLAQLFTDTNA